MRHCEFPKNFVRSAAIKGDNGGVEHRNYDVLYAIPRDVRQHRRCHDAFEVIGVEPADGDAVVADRCIWDLEKQTESSPDFLSQAGSLVKLTFKINYTAKAAHFSGYDNRKFMFVKEEYFMREKVSWLGKKLRGHWKLRKIIILRNILFIQQAQFIKHNHS